MTFDTHHRWLSSAVSFVVIEWFFVLFIIIIAFNTHQLFGVISISTDFLSLVRSFVCYWHGRNYCKQFLFYIRFGSTRKLHIDLFVWRTVEITIFHGNAHGLFAHLFSNLSHFARTFGCETIWPRFN